MIKIRNKRKRRYRQRIANIGDESLKIQNIFYLINE